MENRTAIRKYRLIEFLIVCKYRVTEFFGYTVCGINFYRNYSRFYYWEKKSLKENE